MRRIGSKRRGYFEKRLSPWWPPAPGGGRRLTDAEFERVERRRLIRYVVLFGLGMIVAAYCGTKSRQERLACIAAGGTEVRNAQGKNPYCVPPPDTTPLPDAAAPPSVLQTRTPTWAPELGGDTVRWVPGAQPP